MPGGDGTGPMGMGAMTGRAAGFCAGYASPGYVNPVGGRGFGGVGRGRGGGWGPRSGFGIGRFGWGAASAAYPSYAPVAPAAPRPGQELQTLQQQAAHFQNALADIQKRIDELAAETPSE